MSKKFTKEIAIVLIFVHGELTGWLWFAIGWFHESDRFIFMGARCV